MRSPTERRGAPRWVVFRVARPIELGGSRHTCAFWASSPQADGIRTMIADSYPREEPANDASRLLANGHAGLCGVQPSW